MNKNYIKQEPLAYSHAAETIIFKLGSARVSLDDYTARSD
jgi:hypothetical protein